MKSIELLPTGKNIIDNIYKDPFHRNKEIMAFLEMLTTIEGHFSISIDGKWGSGKTFFVKECELALNVLNDENGLDSEKRSKVLHSLDFSKDDLKKKLKKQKCIYFDAWANDSYDNPIIAILNTLISSQSLLKQADIKQLTSTLEKLTESFFSNKVGIDLTLLKYAMKPKEVEDFQEQVSLHEYIKKVINNLTRKDQRLNIFVDELDRCNPRFAVKLLEQIKHYFLLDNVTFIFSTNILELSKTINKFYGNDFRGDKYLNRFFDLSLSIPEIDADSYFDYLISENSLLVYIKNELAIIKFLNMSLRGINNFIANNRIIDYMKLGNNPEIFTQVHKTIYMDIVWSVVPILIGVRTVNYSSYAELLSGKNEKLFANALEHTEFWNLLRYDASASELLSLCNLDKNNTIEDNKDNIVKTIYDKLFVTTLNRNQVKTKSDNFWYAVNQNLNEVLKTISSNFHFE